MTLKLNMSPAKRLELRKRKSAPIMKEYKEWLDIEILNPQVLPKNKNGIAILYVLNRWNELTRFLEDGRIELSNNWIENLFRLLALGRRNWLFCDTPKGALANLPGATGNVVHKEEGNYRQYKKRPCQPNQS